jgi:hypothetical protein
MGVGLALLASLGINRLPLMISDGMQDVLSLGAFGVLIALFFWAAKADTQQA